jgi:uncharacterized protein
VVEHDSRSDVYFELHAQAKPGEVNRMLFFPPTSRREFICSASTIVAGSVIPAHWLLGKSTHPTVSKPLDQFDYGQVTIHSELHEKQLEQTIAVLMGLNEDSLLKPFHQMSGQPAPGDDLGGWYVYNPDFDFRKGGDGFAPGATFGQWVSALSRTYAIRKDDELRAKVLRLNRLYVATISGDYYEKNRFPTYCYDKLVCGLIDAHRYVGDPDAFSMLDRTTNAALPHFPSHAIEHDTPWRLNKDESWTWDESYTMSENLFLAYQLGAGERYRKLAEQYLDDHYYEALAANQNVLAGRHAYSYVNSLSSAMQAYLTLASEKHFRAAQNGFEMLSNQSFATGGWGPDEQLRAPATNDLYDSLTRTHASFETPCGSYAHFKLTRYLLRVTRDSRYGDSMERVMYNTILGAKPLMADGRTFYYSDYNFRGRKVYRETQQWACCSGTLPQVAADYRISTYFRDEANLWVNLYIPSTLEWKQDGADVRFTQKGDFPFAGSIECKLHTSKPAHFGVSLRIPAWANGASVSINGRTLHNRPQPGSFAAIHRKWKNGDRVELELPMSLRLEPIDRLHPQTVALLYGPMVLFPITESKLSPTRAELLAAKKVDSKTWQIQTGGKIIRLMPFTEIAEEQYSTYFNLD